MWAMMEKLRVSSVDMVARGADGWHETRGIAPKNRDPKTCGAKSLLPHLDPRRDFVDGDPGFAEGVPDFKKAFEGQAAVGFQLEFPAGVLFLVGLQVGSEQALRDGEGVEGDVSGGIHGDDGARVADGFGGDFADGGQLDLEDLAGLLEGGGDDEKDQQDEQDIDHRHDGHLGPAALDAVKMHLRGRVVFGASRRARNRPAAPPCGR